MRTAQKRVLVIGLDGATFDLVRPWAAEGHLPNLARLVAEGSRGPLASTLQPATAPAWATFMTGMNQGKHGLYDFVQRREGSYDLELTHGGHVRAPTIFETAGLRAVALNVPYTFPPRPVEGVVIGGPFAPVVTPDLVHPPAFFETLTEIAPDYFVLADYDDRAPDPMADFRERLLHGVALRERVAHHLLGSEDWDLFTVVFMATDEVQHTFWHCMEAPAESPDARYRHAIRDVYARVDEAIGRLIASAEGDGRGRDTIVFVVSDHGAGPFRWMVNLNRWLADAGYVRFGTSTTSRARRLRSGVLKSLATRYRQHVPADARARIRSRLGMRRFDRLKEGFESALLASAIDWPRTRAYALGAGGNIFVNLQGREPAGTVRPGSEYEAVREALAADLMQMTEPGTGRPMVRRVHRREELYSGPGLGRAPDLVIEWSDYAFWGRGRYDSGSAAFEAQRRFDFSRKPLSGSHRPEGILIAHGPSIRPGAEVAGARLVDMAPTILALAGVPPSQAMDGRVLEEMVVAEEAARIRQLAAERRDLADTPEFAFDPEEAERIAERLRSLGYL
jgi:predicted AlkP superfamily phosphohydrolase/phosphomutase